MGKYFHILEYGANYCTIACCRPVGLALVLLLLLLLPTKSTPLLRLLLALLILVFYRMRRKIKITQAQGRISEPIFSETCLGGMP